MLYKGNGIYTQSYYSDDYGKLQQVLSLERKRLTKYEVSILEVAFTIREDRIEKLMWYMTLYIKHNKGEKISELIFTKFE